MTSNSNSSSSSSASMKTLMVVLKLDGKNFPLWRIRVQAHLMACDLYDACLHEKSPNINVKKSGGGSSGGSSSSDDDDWMQKQKLCYSFIILNLNDDQLSAVQDVDIGNSYQLWQRIITKYDRTTIANKSHLRHALHNIRMESGESFDLYRSRINEKCIQLRNIKVVVPDDEKLFVLLNGLPDKYSARAERECMINSRTGHPCVTRVLNNSVHMCYLVFG